MFYRKKPVVVEAVTVAELQPDYDRRSAGYQYAINVPDWVKEAFDQCIIRWNDSPQVLLITTLEGEMEAQQTDMLIKGVKGELYPCKPDIFEATYEPA